MDAKKILELLRDNYQESIFITDGEGNVVFANKVAAERLGADCEELEGCNVNDLLAKGIYQHSTTLDALKLGETVVSRINAIDNNHTYSNSVPVFGDDGKVKFVVTNNMSLEHNLEWHEIIEKEQQENSRMRRQLDYFMVNDQSKFIANSSVMKKIINMLEIVSPTDVNVVILGESGTGKDMIARLIHEKSNRAKHAFISINCAAMPENLLESELFGYEAGAFTGALSKGKIGLFEAASGGTIFLDEIGEMSLGLQSKLLRTLENHEIRRVGGIKNIPVDCRVICATNVDLQKAVDEKQFREDLYYRLNVFCVELPSLKERKDDILPIAEMFLDMLNQKYGAHKVLAHVTRETMLNYNWPGNIRELRNVIERLFVVSRGNELVFTPVPTAEYKDSFSVSSDGISGYEYNSLKEFLNCMEEEYISQVMEECGGSVSKSAEKLGIHRSVLYRKLQKKDKSKHEHVAK